MEPLRGLSLPIYEPRLLEQDGIEYRLRNPPLAPALPAKWLLLLHRLLHLVKRSANSVRCSSGLENLSCAFRLSALNQYLVQVSLGVPALRKLTNGD